MCSKNASQIQGIVDRNFFRRTLKNGYDGNLHGVLNNRPFIRKCAHTRSITIMKNTVSKFNNSVNNVIFMRIISDNR